MAMITVAVTSFAMNRCTMIAAMTLLMYSAFQVGVSSMDKTLVHVLTMGELALMLKNVLQIGILIVNAFKLFTSTLGV